MKVLVTGAIGFIGFYVIRLLKDQGFFVRALAGERSDTSELQALGMELVKEDKRSEFPSQCAKSLPSYVSSCHGLQDLVQRHEVYI